MGKWYLQASLFIFDRIFVKLAANQDRHKIPGRTESVTSELRAPEEGLNFQ